VVFRRHCCCCCCWSSNHSARAGWRQIVTDCAHLSTSPDISGQPLLSIQRRAEAGVVASEPRQQSRMSAERLSSQLKIVVFFVNTFSPPGCYTAAGMTGYMFYCCFLSLTISVRTVMSKFNVPIVAKLSGLLEMCLQMIYLELVFTARCYASAVLAMALCLSVCLSVCPSQVGVLLKRLNVGSHKQHHTIAQGL